MTLPARVEAAILAHARAAAPEECCGLLIGTPTDLVDAHPARNVAADRRRRYVIDPQDHFAAIRVARGRGLDVVGAYHSHPRATARPSPTDAEEAFGPFVFLIAGLGVEPPALAAYTWTGGNFSEVPLVRSG